MLHTKKKLGSNGFGHIEFLMLVIVLACIFGVGYYVIDHLSSHKSNSFTSLAPFYSEGVEFSEEACITSQTGTAPNQIDTVLAQISSNVETGPKTEVVSNGQTSGGYNPLAYYSINNSAPTAEDNWITSIPSTISFTLTPANQNSNFSLGVEPSSLITSAGSSQSIGSLSLCQPSKIPKLATIENKTSTSSPASPISATSSNTTTSSTTSSTTTSTSSASSPASSEKAAIKTTTNTASPTTSSSTPVTTIKKTTTPSPIQAIPPIPTVTLSGSPTSISYDSSSTLSWNSNNATSCSASGGWSGNKSLSGSTSTGTLTNTTSYTIDCIGAGGNVSANVTIIVGSKPSTLYTGKLLGMNTSLTATYNSQTTTTGILNQLGVNSMRGEIDFNGSSFNNPNGDGTIANWIDTLTSAGIVPLPLMNQYVELDTLNVTGFASSLTTWCKAYCAGGSFYVGNSSANGDYAPQILEILNEPYGNWNGYGGPTDADVEAYATLLKDIRSDLNNAGLGNIGITAAANPISFGSANWDADLLADGGFAAAQGIVVHPYGVVDLSSQTGGSSTDGWGIVYEEHDMLVNAGLSANANVYATEDGWCTNQAAEPAGYTVGADCVDNYFLTESQKDTDISTVIGQLKSVSWLKGLWYYNLYPYSISGQWNSFGLYEPGTWNGDGLYVSGAATPAWGAFQSAAQANGF